MERSDRAPFGTSRGLIQVKLRMPSDIRRRLEKSAKKHKRSLSSEAVELIKESLERPNRTDKVLDAVLDKLSRMEDASR